MSVRQPTGRLHAAANWFVAPELDLDELVDQAPFEAVVGRLHVVPEKAEAVRHSM